VPLLRFNTEQGQASLSQFRKSVETMRAEVTTAYSSTDTLVGGAWEAPVAHEFMEQVLAWRQQMDGTLEVLSDLSHRLEREIQEWETTAAVFAGGSGGAGAINGPAIGVGQPGSYHPGQLGGGGGGSWGSDSPFPYSDYSNFDYNLEDSSRFDGTVIPEERFYRKEDEFYANILHEEIGIGDMWQRSEGAVALGALGVATATVGVGGYEIGSSAQLGFSDDGLAGKATVGAELYAVDAEITAEVAGAEIAVEAQVGASIGGEAEIEIDLMDGEIELEGEVGAFIGVSVEGEATREIGPAEFGAEVEAGVGFGASASGEIEFEDGKFRFQGNTNAYVGVGGGFGFSFEVDIPEAAEGIVDVGSEGVDILGDLTGWW